jgi:hypothetical protein
MKIILGDFNAKVGRENIFKPTTGNERLHETSNDNGFRVANFATSKNLVARSTMFPHRKIHKYTWTSPEGKTHNQIDHILTDRFRRNRNMTDQIFYIRQILEKKWEFNGTVHQLFIDFKKVYHSVSEEVLCSILI